jgi:hypothetical protein
MKSLKLPVYEKVFLKPANEMSNANFENKTKIRERSEQITCPGHYLKTKLVLHTPCRARRGRGFNALSFN